MTYWTYLEPGDDGQPKTIILSEAEILATFYPYWCDQMRKVGKDTEISQQSCIDDWVVVHWASKVV